MSNGQCSNEEDKILAAHDRFERAGTTEAKVQILGDNFRDHALNMVRKFSGLYKRLPWRPWMLNVLAGVGILGFAGFIWAASAFNKDVQNTQKCSAEAKQTALEAKTAVVQVRDDLTGQLKPVSEASAVANAKLDMLLESRGMSGPSRNRIRQAAVELGLSQDTTAHDSVGP